MISQRHWWMFRLLGRRVSVPINQCVHYGAFRYGCEEDHPYETYARLLVRDDDRDGARSWFVGFVRQYRPRHLGEALGVNLSACHGLWHFPWARNLPPGNGWFEDPDGFDDIVTHYSEAGLLWFRIEQEFFWLERSVYSIRTHGYCERPNYGLFAQRIVRADGQEAFLILDGNHRLSALAALGNSTVELSYIPHHSVLENNVTKWPQVRSGNWTESDARAALNAYFVGNPRWQIAATPAPLLEVPSTTLPF